MVGPISAVDQEGMEMKQTFSQVVGATAAITLGLLPNLAEAQGPPPDPARRAELVKRFDADGDGVLSPEEIKAAHAARSEHGPKIASDGKHPSHKASDTKRLAVANNEEIERLLRRFDRDGNGKLNFAEMDALRVFTKTRSDRENGAGVRATPPVTGAATERPHSLAHAGGEGHE